MVPSIISKFIGLNLKGHHDCQTTHPARSISDQIKLLKEANTLALHTENRPLPN
jgi:hypothetical protein